MISEIDIRDWEKVEINKARQALDNFDDYSRMAGINPIGALKTLEAFINYVEKIKTSQYKQTAVLLRKKV